MIAPLLLFAALAQTPSVPCPAGFVCVPEPAAAALKIPTPVTPPVTATQTQGAASKASSCPSFYAAGALRNPQSSPQWAGWAAVATPYTACGSAQPVYSITLYNVQLLKGGAFQNTVSTGLAFPFRTFGPVTIYAFGTAGAAVASTPLAPPTPTSVGKSITNLQGAFSGGGAATIAAWKGFQITPWVQILKGVSNTATIIGIGVGHSW